MKKPRKITALPRAGKYRAIYADPPWPFETFSGAKVPTTDAAQPYATMTMADIAALPVRELAARDCALFLWVTWPTLPAALKVIEAWGFKYKTCGFAWFKGNSLPLFPDDYAFRIGLGYWTRSNSEVCLIATRGKPKRRSANVGQVVAEPVREHSRKPDCIRERIEALVEGPYVELFARQRRKGWDAWGNEVGRFSPVKRRAA